jgi:hypothetical protein
MTLRGRRKPYPVIARSTCNEAIQLFLCDFWIASLLLAMTLRGRRKPHPVIVKSQAADREIDGFMTVPRACPG